MAIDIRAQLGLPEDATDAQVTEHLNELKRVAQEARGAPQGWTRVAESPQFAVFEEVRDGKITSIPAAFKNEGVVYLQQSYTETGALRTVVRVALDKKEARRAADRDKR